MRLQIADKIIIGHFKYFVVLFLDAGKPSFFFFFFLQYVIKYKLRLIRFKFVISSFPAVAAGIVSGNRIEKLRPDVPCKTGFFAAKDMQLIQTILLNIIP